MAGPSRSLRAVVRSGLVVEAGVVEDVLGERGAVVDLVEVEVLVPDP